MNSTHLPAQSQHSPGPLDIVQWWIGILELLVFAIGVPMNAVVLFLALDRRGRRARYGADGLINGCGRDNKDGNVTELLVISQSVADFLFCSIHCPMMFAMFAGDIQFTPIPCLSLFAVTHASTVASSISLLWLNINKFLYLFRPLHYYLYVTKFRALACVLLGWLASAIWALLFVLGPFISYDGRCNIYLRHKSVYVVFAFGFFVLPTLVSLVVSIYVALVVAEARFGDLKWLKKKWGDDMQRFRGYSSIADTTTTGVTNNNNQQSTKNNNNNYYHRHQRHSDVSFSTTTTTAIYEQDTGKPVLLAPPQYSTRSRQKPLQPSPQNRKKDQRSGSKRGVRIRKISFVFVTTIWSSLTVLPYRLALIENNISQPDDDGLLDQAVLALDEEEPLVIPTKTIIYFCLFALMTLNACGNPFITIITQHQYSIRLAKIICRIARCSMIRRCCFCRGGDKIVSEITRASPSLCVTPVRGSLIPRPRASI